LRRGNVRQFTTRLGQQRECRGTDIGTMREAEKDDGPAAAKIIGGQWLAVRVDQRQFGERPRRWQQRRILRGWRRAGRRRQQPGRNEPERKRYNGNDDEPEREACGHDNSVAPAVSGWFADYPISLICAMTQPTTFRKRPPRQPTVEALIRYGAREFEQAGLAFGHGTGDATDDAAALVFHALGLDHADAAREYVRAVAADEVEAVLALFAARIERRIPAAYLMGRMWFAGLEFEVDERVIVPRSPFAELIHAGFEPWLEPSRVRRILDVGTGSGCIAIACAVQFPDARIDAVDISPDALEIAQRNAARHGVAGRVQFHQGDVY
jgi:hypothetical protein